MNEDAKWEELSREEVFKAYGRAIHKVMCRMPDGSEAEFLLRHEGDPVCVVALTKDNQVILAKQFRPGPGEILWELPGGAMEKGEKPEEAMARELLEETGYAGEMEFVTRCWDDAYSNTRRYCFVATECEKVGEQKLDEHEFAEVVLVSISEFRNLLRKGLMSDVEAGYLGLDYLNLL